jgi:pyridinium-3,5-bisthiocarboxylic acid mononucleotide nickel chelatase
VKLIRTAYFDCFSGVSGDMVLGALVDAGVDLRAIESELRKLGLEGWTISAEKVKRGQIFATQVKVATSEGHHHRGLATILGRIEKAQLAPRAENRARRIFTRLAESEARVHNMPVEQVHFHEVGAVDSIVDIVGAAVGFELLGVDEFACSPLDVGAGQVMTAHGLLPVPAPATADLLKGAPVYTSGIQKELVTPTGAAIATTLSSSYTKIPEMTLTAIGYGAGSADFPEKANVMRLLIGERESAGTGTHSQGLTDAPITVIETNLDDMSPQIYGYFVERALQAGALDVFSTAVSMKKNRPGLLVTILCEPSQEAQLTDLLFSETTTIGARMYEARRRTLAREFLAVETGFGEVRMKISRMNGSVLNATPEYDDCQRIAAAQGIPLKEVLAAAAYAFQKQRESRK